jgi:hypothetical protein
MASAADAPPIVARTVGELLARAAAIGLAREQAAAEKLAAEHKRRVKEAEVKASGARSRPRSSGATVQPMTRRRHFSSIFRRSPRNEVRSRTSFVDFTRSVRSMSARNDSSNGWQH